VNFDLVTIIRGIDNAVRDEANEKDEENDSWVGGLGEIENLTDLDHWYGRGQQRPGVHLDGISIDPSLN
jgi:hypothetical protein